MSVMTKPKKQRKANMQTTQGQNMQDLLNTETWNDDQLFQATKMLYTHLNESKINLKYGWKAGSWYQDYENCIRTKNQRYDIGVYENHNIWFKIYVNDQPEDFESNYKWEDLMNNPQIVVDEFVALKRSVGR